MNKQDNDTLAQAYKEVMEVRDAVADFIDTQDSTEVMLRTIEEKAVSLLPQELVTRYLKTNRTLYSMEELPLPPEEDLRSELARFVIAGLAYNRVVRHIQNRTTAGVTDIDSPSKENLLN